MIKLLTLTQLIQTMTLIHPASRIGFVCSQSMRGILFGFVLIFTVFGPKLALGTPVMASPVVETEASEEPSIFQRFALRRDPPKFFQTVIDLPILLRPQTDPKAEILKNAGINWMSSFRPNDPIYSSQSLGIAILEWLPTDPSIAKVKVKTVEASILVNHRSATWLVTTFGFGLGLMDGLIYFNDERVFDPRLEPFIPFQIGWAARLGDSFQLGVKYQQFTFFRSQPVISLGRVLVSLGYSY